jgi:hypothetical protein
MFVYPWLDSLAQCGTVERIGRFSSEAQTPLEFYGILRSPFVMIFHLPIISDVRHHCEAPIQIIQHQCVTSCDILPAHASTIQHCLDMFGPGLRSRSRPRPRSSCSFQGDARFCLFLLDDLRREIVQSLVHLALCSSLFLR